MYFGIDKVIGFANKYFSINNIDRLARRRSCKICQLLSNIATV